MSCALKTLLIRSSLSLLLKLVANHATQMQLIQTMWLEHYALKCQTHHQYVGEALCS